MIGMSVGRDKIAEIRFDAPDEKVNLLTEALLTRLNAILGDIEAGCRDGTIRAVILTSGRPGVFLAGADVKAFVAVAQQGDPVAAAAKARVGQEIFTRLAALPVPTVAAINGACLGGGFELALACTSRVAGDGPEVSMGLPEVRLGLIPGWGGTQRLPRLVGASRALDLILTGRSLTGRKALKLGVVDAVVPIEGIDYEARREAARLASGGRPRRPRWSWLDTNPAGRSIVYMMARRGAQAQSKGRYPAPMCAIDAVRYGLTRSLSEGLLYEADHVGRLLTGEVSRNLVGIFLASRGGGTAPGSAKPMKIESVGVLGAGTMGGGIAAVAALGAGASVRLKDVSAEALARGMGQVRAAAKHAATRGRLPRHEAARREALVAPTTGWSGFSGSDLVIEAVVEDLEVKRQVLREMEAATGPQAIFATNTSSLSVAAISEAASRPARVLGLHFFNPVEKMPLVEVIRAPATDDGAVEAAVSLVRRMGKTPVVVKDTPGFIVNRILMPYLAGAVEELGRAADPAVVVSIDRAMVDFGMPMGPFALLDQIGIDVAAKVAGVLKAAFPEKPGDARLFHAMMQAGLLGAKSGRGFYVHGRGGKRGKVSPELARLLSATYRPPVGGAVGAMEMAAVADMLVDAMIDEAAALLEQGAVDRPEVIDLAMVFGAGFPPFRGGLLRHADTVGTEFIAGRLRARGVTPAPLLARKGRFYQ